MLRVTAGGRGNKTNLFPAMLITALLLFAAGAGAQPGLFPVYLQSGIPILEVPAISAESLRVRDKSRTTGLEKVMPFAEPFEVSARMDEYGQWEVLDKGRVRWTLYVHAPGATDINIGFTNIFLPAGCTLHLESQGGAYQVGPFTQKNVGDTGQLWTPVLPGDLVTIIAEMPMNAAEQFVLIIGPVNRGYCDVFRVGFPGVKSPPEKQGWCQIDVVCPQTAGWENEIRSVGVYSVYGSLICSGTLIMNQRADFRPFFLTAAHCLNSSSEAASVVVYWNYESPTCGALSGGSLNQHQSGASLRATYNSSDFTLLELHAAPNTAFNTYYAGWDRSGSGADTAVGIHHPNTDEKAFCHTAQAIQSTSFGGYFVSPGANHWRVVSWSLGATEPGSSGSGLWNAETKRLVGQLHGGYSACGNTSSDWYGKLSSSWTGGGATSSRLQNWLDPDSTGIMGMNGADPSPVTPCTLEEGLDAPGLSWTTGGHQAWDCQRLTTYDGVAAAQSGPITHDEESWLETTVVGPGTIRFWWKVSSEADYDFLRFRIGANERARISGEVNWRLRTFSVPSGTHTLRWIYTKDHSVNRGEDAGWVDQVLWIPRDPSRTPLHDFDGNGISDMAVYSAATGQWYIRSISGERLGWAINWGFPGTMAIPGDFNGNGQADLGIYHPQTGAWYIRTLAGQVLANPAHWGFPGAVPVVGDFNGDGRDDIGVYHPATGSWYIRTVSGRVLANPVHWGFPGAVPVVGDFDGDGRDDLGIYNPANGRWYIRSLNGRILADAVGWGFPGAQPVPVDFNGDGRTDLAVYHAAQGRWYVRRLTGRILASGVQHGFPGALPIAGDFDGDRIYDLAVYHPPAGRWYIRRPSGMVIAWDASWGWSTAEPAQAQYWINKAFGF